MQFQEELRYISQGYGCGPALHDNLWVKPHYVRNQSLGLTGSGHHVDGLLTFKMLRACESCVSANMCALAGVPANINTSGQAG